MKNIEPGTLLVVEQPFASIDNRVIGEQRCHSINFWQINEKNSDIEYCNDDTLRLLNEIEKQLLIGNTTSFTFEKIQFMQPIRQWLDENLHEQSKNRSSDVLEGYEQILSDTKKWRKSLTK